MSNEIENKVIAICYTDGSTGPSNPGYSGSGMHGYVYIDGEQKINKGNRPKKINITDIGYLTLTDLKHEFKLVQPVKYINGYYNDGKIGTNNQAEVNAVIRTIDNTLVKLPEVTELLIKTDSKYTIHIFEKIQKTNGKSWVGGVNVNLEYWEAMYASLEDAKSAGLTVKIMKVKGHSDSLGNHMADRAALLGRQQYTANTINENFTISEANKYWNMDRSRHPFLFGRQVFFNNSIRDNEDEKYYGILNYKVDVEPGRKTNEAGFGVVRLKEKPKLIEDAINTYLKHTQTMAVISTIDLQELYTQSVMKMTEVFGTAIYKYDRRRGFLHDLDFKQIAYSIRPAGLATNAYDKLHEINGIIDNYLTSYLTNDTSGLQYQFIDVTNKFFGVDEKGKPVTLVDNGANTITYPITYNNTEIKLKLDLGIDMLGRNQLKKIEKSEPRVITVVKELSDKSFEYFNIVHMTQTEDVACYTNFYTNKIFIK